MAARTFSAAADGALASAGGSWNGGTVLATGDTVTFNNTSVHTCTWDTSTSVASITIASTYSGTITCSTAVVLTGNFSIAAGTWDNATFAFNANSGAGTLTVTGGTFKGGTATTSTGAVTFNSTGTIVATSGTWTLAGSWTQSGSTTTFTHSSGTINITATCTFNDARSAFNKFNITGAVINVTVAASTTFPLGSAPSTTVTTGTFTVTGILTWSGLWTHAGNIVTSNGSTLTGTSTPTISADRSLTINATTTVTSAIGTITFTGAAATVITDAGDALSGTTYVFNAAKNATIAASTNCRLGASPTVTISTGILTVNGTMTFSGTCAMGGATLTVASGGTVTGTSTPVITLSESSPTIDPAATITNPVGFILTQTSGTSRTFSGGGKTYSTFVRTGSGSGTLIIAGANTFSTFQDNAGLAAHTLTFTVSITQTAATFLLGGSSGKVLTINSSGSGTAATLRNTGGQPTVAQYASVKDSTVDSAPKWYAGLGSTLVSGNTNWELGGPVLGAYGRNRRRKLRQSA